ncbi:ATP-binding protein [Streptomyces sp. BV286]|uniref:ATP-binding protein n=1 Tax=Streptomyces sp. BV286 TaxID=2849672 RepID=UPI001C2E40FE|nr:ATP-binding protein [Streptomyces sp. BV286]MBV1940782.1 ATP-binding protein [Streptomyces sp. BV286]
MSLTVPAPAAPQKREPVLAGDAMAAVASILRRRGIDPANAALTSDRPDDTDEYQREVNAQAWVNSLRLAGHHDYERFNISKLHEDQFPEHLRSYVDQIVAARTHNRAQMRLPAGEREIIQPSVQHLILHGATGSKKTAAAAAAGAYAVERGLMARFASHAKYLRWLRPDSAPGNLTPIKVVEYYERCDVLILDDLCEEMDEYATNHVRTVTNTLITARRNSGRGTIFTTNLNFDQVETVLGERLASRIGGGAMPLKYESADARKPQRW